MLTHPGRPRIALLCSRRCPGLTSLIRGHRRRQFDLVGCLVTDGEFADRERLEAVRVPVMHHPIRPFYAARRAPLSDLSLRPDYDRRTVDFLALQRPDVLLLSSYLYLLTGPVLEAYPDRIVNVHGSDMARLGPDGRPLYPGLDAVRDAIRAGEKETRATAHIVTERLDDGPILLRSRPFPVAPFVGELRRTGNLRAVHAYAFAHQEWMLEAAWGPLLTGAIALVGARGVRPPLWAPPLPVAPPVQAAGAQP